MEIGTPGRLDERVERAEDCFDFLAQRNSASSTSLRPGPVLKRDPIPRNRTSIEPIATIARSLHKGTHRAAVRIASCARALVIMSLDTEEEGVTH